MAATEGVLNRGWCVSGGLLGGVAGAGLIAVFADVISSWASGMGQEVFNACVMFIAVVMLAWHSIWMGKHSREMAQQISSVGKAVAAGSRPLTGLAIVVGVAVLREGSEAVLFLYGIAAGDPGHTPQMIVGGLLGIFGGVGLGAAMYAGLLQIPLKRLFAVGMRPVGRCALKLTALIIAIVRRGNSFPDNLADAGNPSHLAVAGRGSSSSDVMPDCR